jgi:PAS domain S-box-containing protein
LTAQATNYLTGDAAFAVDRRGLIVCWNSAAERLFGHSTDSALGQRCWKLLSGQDIYGNRYCCERCPLREMALRHESVHGFQASFTTAANGRKNFAVSCVEVFGSDGDELLLHICRDPEETAEHREPDHAAAKPSANFHRGALTTREHEVLKLLAEGKTTPQIASLMCISDATVRNHIQHLLYKLHVHNRLEAVVKGQHLDLI